MMQVNRPQKATPYLSGLLAYVQRGVVPFHTPGHKQGRALPSVLADCREFWAGMDLSDVIECPEAGNDEPTVLRNAERLAADLYGVERTLFLSNGTSQGIIGMLLAVGCEQEVLLARNCHISAVRGLILSGANPRWLPVMYDATWALPVGVDLSSLNESWQDLSSVMVVHPTYHGFVNDFTLLRRFCDRTRTKLLVDEAHGPHFVAHEGLPPSAVTWSEATAVAQSPHKMLSSFTGSAWLHVVHPFDRVDHCVKLIQSTSPSPLLLASLDAARWQLAQQGRQLFGRTLDLAMTLRERIAELPGLWCPTPEELAARGIVDWDPLKLLVFVTRLGISGLEAKRYLRQVGLEAELADPCSVLFLLTPGDNDESADALIEGLGRLTKEFTQDKGQRIEIPLWPDLPPQRLTPREAFLAQCDGVDIRGAKGRVAGSVLAPYPPGIPVLVPGEEITEQVVEYVIRALVLGVSFNQDPSRLRVVK
jgi:arginine decarboxylase